MFNLVSKRSYVVEGSRPLTPSDFPQVPGFDQIFLGANDLDIKLLRAQIAQFQQSPSGDMRLLAINNADNLSELLQNTLLKTVEEPPSKGVVVLQASTREALLPTLRSRLEKIYGNEPEAESRPQKELDVSSLFSLDRSAAVKELESVMASLDMTSRVGVYRHDILERTIRKMKRNVNLKLALDWLDLNWHPESGKE